MSARSPMGSRVAATPPGSHRVAAPHALPSAAEDPAATVENEDREARETWRAAVAAYGGPDALRARRLHPPSYLSKINESLTDDERPAQWRWLWTLLADKDAAAVLVPAINARAGYAPPVKMRSVTREEVERATAAVVAKMGPLWGAVRELVASELGVSVEDVTL